jgi:hypothetical protein
LCARAAGRRIREAGRRSSVGNVHVLCGRRLRDVSRGLSEGGSRSRAPQGWPSARCAAILGAGQLGRRLAPTHHRKRFARALPHCCGSVKRPAWAFTAQPGRIGVLGAVPYGQPTARVLPQQLTLGQDAPTDNEDGAAEKAARARASACRTAQTCPASPELSRGPFLITPLDRQAGSGDLRRRVASLANGRHHRPWERHVGAGSLVPDRGWCGIIGRLMALFA